jgi:phosphoribosylamine--glycine ligase
MATGSPINVLLIGSGGREHALGIAIANSPRVGTLFASHDNPGLAAISRPIDVPVSAREAYRTVQFIEKHNIGLVVIGPEDPLAEGLADKLASETCKVFGPGRAGAQLEADKAWCKQMLRSASIPTGEGRVFTDAESARGYLETRCVDEPLIDSLLTAANDYRDPADRRKFIQRELDTKPAMQKAYDKPRGDLPVIKATGLAKGKGVVVPASLSEAHAAIEQIMVKRVFGDAGAKVLIEEKLSGPEVSVLAITDGSSILVLPPAQDHKRLLDGDKGPNTGGMGAFCPSTTLDDKLMTRVEREVLVPIVDALKRESIDYKGVLFAGLMLTPAGPKVLEFNCRFGDPECQAIISRLDSDILELMMATCEGRLADVDVRWKNDASCCVVIASEGYPEKPKSGAAITGIDAANRLEGVTVYHAGTKKLPDGTIVTNGGRILGVTALAPTLSQARDRAYEAAAAIGFVGKVMRTDIGSSAT